MQKRALNEPLTGSGWVRRLPVGAELQASGGVHFRVWAPKRSRVEVVLGEDPGAGGLALALTPEAGGYHAGFMAQAGPGTRYAYRLDGEGPFPDPASRFQPDGPHRPSQVVDPSGFTWTDGAWAGLTREGQVLYEMHAGTFTPEGTWRSALEDLPALRELGITAIELMPVADFPGRFGWGYDGVDLFAPTRLYGTPDDLRGFVNRAHELGLGVILDVVYNHAGPDGSYLAQFASEYFSPKYETEWGRSFNFDAEGSGPVREFFLANACYWVEEFHLDGLRIDATQSIFDCSSPPILAEICTRIRSLAESKGRSVLIVGENEPQQADLVRPVDQGGMGLDAVWSEDFHHAAMVALTGRRQGYYSAHLGSPQELLSAVKRGFLYQGQRYAWQHKRRGSPTFGMAGSSFVFYLQNHDQVANSIRSLRSHALTSPARHRAMTALFLLAPATPHLFQGQEFAASTPFHYFIDQQGALADAVRQGQRRFLSQFASLAHPDAQAYLAEPADPETFARCKLDPQERARNTGALALHRDLLALRRSEPFARSQRASAHPTLDGAVLGPDALAVRYFGNDEDDRLLLVNLGREFLLEPAPEPLLAPPLGRRWRLLWSSEDPHYGGSGTPATETERGWCLAAESAVVMIPEPLEDQPGGTQRAEPDHLEGERPRSA